MLCRIATTFAKTTALMGVIIVVIEV